MMTTRRKTRGDRTQGGGSPLRRAPAFVLLLALAALPPACSKKSSSSSAPPGPGLVITESGGSTGVSEAGGTDTYTVALNTSPTSDVTVTVTPDAQLTGAPLTLTFTTADWNAAQTVTVGAVDDGNAEGNHTGTLLHATSSLDAAYDGLAASLPVDVLDNDTLGSVSGTLLYTNSFYDYDPAAVPSPTLTRTPQPLPVRHAEVEVVRASDGTVLGSGVTDGAGAYAIDVANVGITSAFVRVYARRRDATSGILSPYDVVVSSGSAVWTAATSSASLNTSIPQTVDATLPLAASSPFNIFDVALLTQQFLNTLDGAIVDPPALTLYWSSGSNDGTYFNPNTNSIHLLGLSSDSDDFDDDIILHELGHYVSSNFSRDDSIGGSHSLSGHYDIRLTWSEGWAHFWAAAVRQWAHTAVAPAGRYPDYVWQIDTFGASSFGAWQIGLPSYAASAYGADNEVSVAALLWDIAAGAADGGSLGLGFDEIWDVIHARFQDRYDPLTNERFATLEDFHDEWYAAPYTSIASILSARTVRYATDLDDVSPASNNDTGATAVALGALPASKTLRTFFKTGTDPVGDEDWFSFSVANGTAYRVETSNLGDGADTYLHVYRDAAGTDLVGEDDDGAGNLASRVTFSATSTGTYYVKVSPYPGDPPYPAVDQVPTYGSYTLSVSVP